MKWKFWNSWTMWWYFHCFFFSSGPVIILFGLKDDSYRVLLWSAFDLIVHSVIVHVNLPCFLFCQLQDTAGTFSRLDFEPAAVEDCEKSLIQQWYPSHVAICEGRIFICWHLCALHCHARWWLTQQRQLYLHVIHMPKQMCLVLLFLMESKTTCVCSFLWVSQTSITFSHVEWNSMCILSSGWVCICLYALVWVTK